MSEALLGRRILAGACVMPSRPGALGRSQHPGARRADGLVSGLGGRGARVVGDANVAAFVGIALALTGWNVAQFHEARVADGAP